MHIILHANALLLALCIPAAQEPTAMEMYQAFARPFADAAAIEVSYTADAVGRAEPVRAEYRLGRPLFGSFRLQMGGDVKEAVADGKALSFLDPERKEYVPTLGGLSDLPLVNVLAPIHCFLSGKVTTPKSVAFAPDQPEHALLRVLVLEFDQHTETLWLADGRQLLAAVVRQTLPGGDEMRYDVVFDRCVAPRDAKAEDYKTAVPAGYKLAASPDSSLLAVGSQAPNATFTDVDGNEFDLESLRGKTVLLNFWFLLCPPCREELPQLSALSGEIQGERGDDVVILCVNRDDQVEAVLDYWFENEFLMTPVLQENGALDKAFGVRSWPVNYVIGPDGRVLHASSGWDAATMRSLLLGQR